MKHLLCALRAFTEAAFWLGCISAIVQVFVTASDLSLVPVIAASVAFIVSFITEKYNWVRAAAMLLTAVSFILCHHVADWLMTVPLVVYLVLSGYYNKLYPDYYEMSDFFGKAIACSVFGLLINLITKSSWALTLTTAFVVSYILLLRLCRDEKAGITDKRVRGLEAVFAIICVSACFLISRKTFLAGIAYGASLIGRLVLYPIVVIMTIIGFGISWLFNFDHIREQQETKIDFDALALNETLKKMQVSEVPGWVKWIPRVIGIAIFLGIAFLLFYKLLKRLQRKPTGIISGITRSRVSSV